jgi:RNA polymerase primary sigma factor
LFKSVDTYVHYEEPGWNGLSSREHSQQGEETGLGDEHEPRQEGGNVLLAYIRDMAHYPLLNPREEKDLAAEIHASRQRLLTLLPQLPVALREIEALKEALQAEGENREGGFADLIESVLERLKTIDQEALTDEGTQAVLGQIYEEEVRLRRASDHMVRSNLRLVFGIAKRYRDRGLSLPDLIQEGNIGLMKAAVRFDPERGYRFSTYATWWIWQAIHRAVKNKGGLIHIPAGIYAARDRYRRLMAAIEEFEDMDPEQIMEQAELSPYQFEALQNLVKEPVSLEIPLGQGERKLGDLLPDHMAESPSDVVLRRELSTILQETLKLLSPREEQIVRLRFGINHERSYTLAEIGEELGISRERVRQIERKAIDKLKRARGTGRFRELQAA